MPFCNILSAALILTVGLAAAAGPAGAEPVKGRDYTQLKTAQPGATPGKVEILEFFSYGCPHCADLHPRVVAWEKQLPADAVFKRVPVGFGRPAWENLAKAYYALEATGELGKLDARLYEAIHRQRQALADGPSIAAWVARNGGDAARFTAAFDSFSVRAKLNQAQKLVKDYQVMAVPTFTVGGLYSVVGQSEEHLLATTTALIARAKAQAAADERQRNASR